MLKNLKYGKSNLGPTMFKFKSSTQVKLESEFGKDVYTKVAGLEKLYIFQFWALAKFCLELQLSNGQTEPYIGLN